MFGRVCVSNLKYPRKSKVAFSATGVFTLLSALSMFRLMNKTADIRFLAYFPSEAKLYKDKKLFLQSYTSGIDFRFIFQ